MSRSRRKPYYVMTPRLDKDIAHGQVRARVRAELCKPEPDHQILEADAKELGLLDWGTVFGLEFDVSDEDFWDEEKKRASRK